MSPEARFEQALDVFRQEAEAGVQFFYTWRAIHARASEDRVVQDALNRAPDVWNTILAGLQSSTLISLGRLFGEGRHNVDTILRLAQSTPELFTKEALRRRKRGEDKEPPSWLDDYVDAAYEPNDGTFARLRCQAEKYNSLYKANYRPLRDRVYAHKVVHGLELEGLFGKTRIGELQRLLLFPQRLHAALFNLYHNGRKPILRSQRYIVSAIRATPRSTWTSRQSQEIVIAQTDEFFDLLEVKSTSTEG